MTVDVSQALDTLTKAIQQIPEDPEEREREREVVQQLIDHNANDRGQNPPRSSIAIEMR